MVMSGNGWEKLAKVTVPLHGTAFPKSSADNEKFGVRFDFAGTVERENKIFNRFQVQVNAGKIPTPWKEWRERNGKGTHGIVATVEVPQDATKDEVQEALEGYEEAVLDN